MARPGSHRLRRRRSRLVAVVAAVVATAALLVAPLATAANAAPDGGLSGTPSSMWQTNAQVTNLAYANGVLYAGGDFTAVRPPNVAQGGTGTVTRTYLAAFNATTGALITSFNYTLNGKVRALAVSSDGSTLYVGGAFTTVNGATHNRLASINLGTGAVNAWAPAANNTVDAIYATPSAVYVGGVFTLLNSVSQPYLGDLSPTTGKELTTFTGSADGVVDALAMSTDGSRLLVGGDYNTISGVAQHGMAAVSLTTGANLAWADTADAPGNMNCDATVTDIVVSGATAYMSEAGAQPGCNDGDYAATVATGARVWFNSCEGGTQTIAVIGSVLYKGSHNHDCGHEPGGAFGGFVGIPPRQTNTTYRHLLAQSTTDGSFVHWDPNTNGGDGQGIGPVAMATDGTQLFVGGDFTLVNGAAQRGLTRFAPKTTNATPVTPAAPTVVGTASGALTVTIAATTDIDTGTLTYNLYRDGGSTPIWTGQLESWPWTSPTVRITDSGLTPGSTHTYKVRAYAGSVASASSAASASATVPSTNLPAYTSVVSGDTPAFFWQLGDQASGTAADSSGHGYTGSYTGGTSTDASGAVAGTSAVALDGSTGYVTANSTMTMGSSWSESVWFKTTTVYGGDLIGFSDAQTGAGTQSNYTIRLDDDGQVTSWFNNVAAASTQPGPPPGPTTIRSPRSYADGHWHNAVVTFTGSTATLYVDGVAVGSAAETAQSPTAGYWRAGYVDLTQANDVFGSQYFQTLGETAPLSYYLQGSLGDASAYNTALSAAQVAALWASNGSPS